MRNSTRVHHRWCGLVFLLLFAGCDRQTPATATPPKPVIVAAIFPIANLVDQLVGDWVDVRTPPLHGSVEQTQATSRDGDWSLTGARFIELAGAPGSPPPTQPATSMSATGETSCPWLDPVLADRFITAIAPRLKQLVPDRSEPLQHRVMLLRADLMLLHREFLARFGDNHRRRLAAWDASFDAMTARYGMETTVHLSEVLARFGRDDPARIEAAAQAVSDGGAAVVVAPVEINDPAITEVARRAGVAVVQLDAVGGKDRENRSTYEGLLRWNLETLLAVKWK